MKTKDIVCAVICMDQRLLIAKRSSGVHENIWEFPGGKVEPEETWEQAVIREVMEELELCVEIEQYLTTICDHREDCTLKVHAYLCKYIRGDIRLHAHHEFALISPHELYNYKFEAADKPILDMLQGVSL